MAEVQLTASQQRELMAMDQAILSAELNLQKAEKAGLDVTALQDTLRRNKALRAGLLQHFSPTASDRTRRQ